MKTPNIINSVWYRNVHVTWSHEYEWRTDVPANVLYHYPVKAVAFALDCGLRVTIPIHELRRALVGASTRRLGRLIGPFNLSPLFSTVNDVPVEMIVEDLESVSAPIYY